ncbi:30S ribosomal protein S14 [Isoptericola haloaureus]|uniref:Small ribosomal subunit protein uS14 n=1 Tax=Isoptericola haloaureus TaxID=1542902 RepID=A0ABU7Z7J4_9MICO
MAKKSKIAAEARRRETVEKYAERRAELQRVIASPSSTDAERAVATMELRRQPRDASRTRLRNRDVVDGRPRAYHRRFGLSRIRLRQMAHRGELPGVTKSSW